MHHPFIQHTLIIFEHMIERMPPLVPAEIAQDMRAAGGQMRHNMDLTADELEDTMIVFGKQIWSYTRAFNEFVEVAEGKLGEKFLLGKLTPAMKKRYKEFLHYGGTYRDLHSGSPATFFTSEERGRLCEALIETHREIVAHTRQLVASSERAQYEKRILEFERILDDMEHRLDTLRLMADNEQEHPELASEIREQIRAFEFGMCLLAPPVNYDAVCNAEEHFQGRKKVHKVRA